VPKTLLAVDDSATMRKVLEITFSGEDFQVLTAANRDGAMAKVGDNPVAVVIDTALEGDDGYAVCKEIRGRLPHAAIVLLSSRYHPYDQAKGRDAGADDYMDKPFDTQQLIDKMKKLIATKEAAGLGEAPYRAPARPAAPAVEPPHAPPAAPPAEPHAPPVQPPHAAPAHTPAAAPSPMGVRPMTPASPPVQAKPRAATLMFPLDGPPAAPPPPAVRVEQPPPQPPPRSPEPPTAAPPAPAIPGAVNGHMAAKLSEMGLTPAQADAVLALSREVVERVVWEVVPQLAEVLIKEEIARLTKE
jgi:CheY-like chemotaxis protein